MAKHDHDADLLLRPAPMLSGMLLPQPLAVQENMGSNKTLSEKQIGAVLESMTDGFAIVDKAWRIGFINARAEDLLCSTHSGRAANGTLLGQELWLAFPELRGGPAESEYRRAMREQIPLSFELYQPSLQRWLEVRAHPSGAGLGTYIQDITQRKKNEAMLRDGGARLQAALSAGRLGDWNWDARTTLVTLGPDSASLLDLPATPLSWPKLLARLPPHERRHIRCAILRALGAHASVDIECRIVDRVGAERWLALTGRGLYAAGGALLGMSGVLSDITLRKVADDTLRRNEEDLRALANSIPQLAWIAHFDGGMTWYNQRWYDYTGTTPEQVAGDGWQAVYDPECLPHMMEHWQASLRSGLPFEMEFPIRGADGEFRWFLTRANPVRDGAGRPQRWFGTSTDVDQVKRAQEALRDESNVLELINSTGTAMACTLDLRELLKQVCDAAIRISGARCGAFCYQGGADEQAVALDALSGPGAALLCQLAPAACATTPADGACAPRAIRIDDLPADPQTRSVRSYLALPVLSRHGMLIGKLVLGHPEPGVFNARTERIIGGIAAQAGVAIDNTRMVEAAQQAAEERKVLLDSERQARAEAERTNQLKDEFLSTLSHELRTPLSAILGWSQVLRRGTRDQADLHRGLQTIERNARAQAQLIEDLLDMSRITSGQVLLDMQAITPASFIEPALEALRPAADAKNIRLGVHYEAAAGAVAGDPSRLQQVIWNLLSNAVKFTPRDGAVRIAVRQVDKTMEIEVADTGIGINGDFLAHVFERFRQADASATRKHGGLGLGLAIVKHLVEQHGGTVRAASAGDMLGASFTLLLPLAAAQARAALRPSAPVPAAPLAEISVRDLSHLKILVVDDEADARELIKRILNDCHAEVFTAASAAQALEIVAALRPDVLVSDIGMPDVDGFELLARIRLLGPALGGDLPAVALTAFARSDDRRRALASGFGAHVPKPVEPSLLIATVAGLAGPGRSTGRGAPGAA